MAFFGRKKEENLNPGPGEFFQSEEIPADGQAVVRDKVPEIEATAPLESLREWMNWYDTKIIPWLRTTEFPEISTQQKNAGLAMIGLIVERIRTEQKMLEAVPSLSPEEVTRIWDYVKLLDEVSEGIEAVTSQPASITAEDFITGLKAATARVL